MTVDVTAFTATFAVFATFVVAGFVLLFAELRRLENKVEAQGSALNTKFDDLRRDLAEEFRATAVPALAGKRAMSEATPAFDWDLHHGRQDACAEKDRIAAQCAQGQCDYLALGQAQRACSGPLGERRP